MKAKVILLFFISIFITACEKDTADDYILKFYGDAYEDIGYSISIASDGYIIAGQLNEIVRASGVVNNDLSDKNMAVIKTDWSGVMKWKVTVGGKYADWGKKIYQLEDTSMICVGTYTDSISPTRMETDIFVVKISSSGELVWQKTYGGPGNQSGTDILQTSEGFIILGSTDVGSTSAAPPFAGNDEGKSDILVLKISDSGSYITSLPKGYSNNDLPAAIKNNGDGTFMILGTTEYNETGLDKNNLILININADLNHTAVKVFGDQTDEYAGDFEVLENGYLIAGTIGKESEVQQAFTRFVDRNLLAPAGPSEVFKINDLPTSVKAIFPYGTDQYVLVGLSGSVNAGEMLILLTDAAGIPVEGKSKITGSTGLQIAYDVAAGDDGYIIAVGRNSYDYNSMMTLLKFRF